MVRLRSQRGMTFIEVIAALAMLSVIYVAMTTLFASSFTFVFAAGPRLTAIAEAQAIADKLYAQDFENRGDISYALEGAIGPDDSFDVTDYDPAEIFGSSGEPDPDAYCRVRLTVVRNGRRADLSVLIPLRPAPEEPEGGVTP